MESVLNITNGDCAVDIMVKAGITGDFLPWRDVLHAGPVPEGLALDALSAVRARFIAEQGWGSVEDVTRSFIERDKVLNSFSNYEKVVLWFEHDLYDQLQLLQILDWFHAHERETTRLSIICTDQYLGMLTPAQMVSMSDHEVAVSDAQLELASEAWAAYRSASPQAWQALLDRDTGALRFLHGAVLRVLEEYPDRLAGLSRTERQALAIVAAGETRPGRVFHANQQCEERVFMGDTVFWSILRDFLQASPPLLELSAGNELSLPPNPDQALSITPAGTDVLSGKRNWLQIRPPDHWIGGVHLQRDTAWCWDSATGALVRAQAI